MSSVSNGLYFLTLPLVSVMRVIYRKIRHACYLYIKKERRKGLGCALYIRCALSIEKYGNSIQSHAICIEQLRLTMVNTQTYYVLSSIVNNKLLYSILRLKCDGTRAATRFRLSAKRMNPFKSARKGRQFSRLLAAEVCASAVVMLGAPRSEVV